MEEILRSGVERSELRPVNTRQATWILLGMAYPFLYPAHEPALGDAQEAIELMVKTFFDGLGA